MGHRAAAERGGIRRALLSACFIALLLPAIALAQSVPSKLRAAILLRALQYEKVFASETSTAVVVVLGGAKGGADAGEMAQVMRQLSEGASGRKVRVDELAGEVSVDAVRRANPAAIYVAEGNEAALPLAAAAGNAIVLCASASWVGKGCMVAVEAAGSASRPVVDLAGAEKKGRTFDARLLRLSRVIR